MYHPVTAGFGEVYQPVTATMSFKIYYFKITSRFETRVFLYYRTDRFQGTDGVYASLLSNYEELRIPNACSSSALFCWTCLKEK